MDARDPRLRNGPSKQVFPLACSAQVERDVPIPSEAAFWLALVWMTIVMMAVVSTVWRPRHTHPIPAQCECAECVIRRAGAAR